MKIIKNQYGIQIEFKLFKIIFKIKIHKELDTAWTVGVRNHTQDGKRVIFLDYDQILLDEMLIPELKYLQEKYKLSEFYILKSSQKPNSYHAICIDKLTSREWVQLIQETSVDQNYKLMPIMADHKSWVLRILPKGHSQEPKYLMTLESKYHKREQSKAHALFLKLHYGIKTKHLNMLDNYTELPLIQYETMSNIK